MRGQVVQNPLPEIRLFSICEGMKWAHLPVAGGLYDQDPRLLDRWRVIFQRRSEYEEEKERLRQSKERSRSAGARIRPSRANY